MKDIRKFHRVKLGLFAIKIVVGNIEVRIIEPVGRREEIVDRGSTVAENATFLNKLANRVENLFNRRFVGRIVCYAIFSFFDKCLVHYTMSDKMD